MIQCDMDILKKRLLIGILLELEAIIIIRTYVQLPRDHLELRLMRNFNKQNCFANIPQKITNWENK